MSKTTQKGKKCGGWNVFLHLCPCFSDMPALTLYWTTDLASPFFFISFVFHKLWTVQRLSGIIFSSLNFRFWVSLAALSTCIARQHFLSQIPPIPPPFVSFRDRWCQATRRNSCSRQVGLCRNACWHLTWRWSRLIHLAEVWNPLTGSARNIVCTSSSNRLFSEAVPAVWSEQRRVGVRESSSCFVGSFSISMNSFHALCPCSSTKSRVRWPRTRHRVWSACWPQHYKTSGLCL